MTMDSLRIALGLEPAIRVVTRSGKKYDVERDVILANLNEDDPLIYGWPVVPRHHRSHGRARWFRASNVNICS